MFRSLVLSAILAVAAVSAFGQQKFAQHSQAIRAGILLTDANQAGGTGLPANDVPHAWYNFDSNVRVKPGAWSIDNPNHPSTATAAIVARWAAINPGADTPAVGARLSKADAAYWEVFLDTLTPQQVSSYDILLMPAHGLISLNSNEREKLRQFMDKGGILWVDLGPTPNTRKDLVNNLPLPFDFSGPSGSVVSTAYTHPVLNYPESISVQDLNLMQFTPTVTPALITGLGGLESIESGIIGDSHKLTPIAVDGSNFNMLEVGPVGDGFEVVTAGEVSTTLNHVPGSVANNTFVGAIPSFDRTSDAAEKLVINMIGLAGQSPEHGGGSRKINTSPIDLDAPLLREWATSTIPLAPTGTKAYSPAVVYKNLVLISSGNQVFAYDVNNASGNTNGLGYTLLWTTSAANITTSSISPPTCFEVPNAATPAAKDQVAVVDENGHVHAFPAFPSGTTNTQLYEVAPPTELGGDAQFNTSGDGPGPYAPTFHEGLLFVSDMLSPGSTAAGRLWIVDPVVGAALSTHNTSWPSSGWGTGGNGQTVLGEVAGPPTVGYIPIQDNSGGMDRVVYVPTRGGIGSATNTAGVTSLWVGARGESSLTPPQLTSTTLIVTTRASQQGLSVFIPDSTDPETVKALGPKLTIVKANGDPFSAGEMAATFDGNVSESTGSITFGVLPGSLLGANPGYAVRVDYTIANWGSGAPNDVNTIQRGQIFLPDQQDNRLRRIVDHIALGPDGTMFMVLSTQDPTTDDSAGGSYMAIREEGRGSFVVRTRYDLYDTYDVSLNQATTVTEHPTITNGDPLLSIFPALKDDLVHLTYMSAPVISNGVAYVTAEALYKDDPSTADTMLFAFDANPAVVEVRSGDLGQDFTILQPDITRSTVKGTPEVYSVLQTNQYVYEQLPGADQGVLRIENLSSTNRGAILNCLSNSQPLVIRKAGAPDVLFEPDSNGSHWNPLLWYTVLIGAGPVTNFGAIGPPLVTGNTIFVPTVSDLSHLLGGPSGSQGIIYGITTEISPNDPELVEPDLQRPWQKQLAEIDPAQAALNVILPNAEFLWPQLADITTISDLQTRISQAQLGPGTIARGVIGGTGKLFTWTDSNLFSFSKANFIVADEGRLSLFDSDGNPLWSTEQTVSTGPANGGTVGTVHPLVHPTRAYPLGSDEYVVVDPGSNRLAILDQSGRELRSLEGFTLDATFRPDGYDANESKAFSTPRDVAVFSSVASTSSIPNPNPFSDAQANEYWVHYVVADAGNRRLLEILDRYSYDPTTNRIGAPIALGELLWHSSASVSGKRFSYTSVARVSFGGQTVFAAGIGNVQPTDTSTGITSDSGTSPEESGTGNGGIVIFNGATTTIINQVILPAIGANALFTPDPTSELSGTFSQPAVPGRTKYLNNLNSVTLTTVDLGAGPQLRIMFTDSTGAYEIPAASGTPTVDWMLPRSVPISQDTNGNLLSAPVYSVMRTTATNLPTTANPLDFRPMYAKRLTSGDILIVNGYLGRSRKAPTDPAQDFKGEIIVLDGSTAQVFTDMNLGLKSSSIKFHLPPVNGGRSIILPVFADRQ
jgi:hypothetical protein